MFSLFSQRSQYYLHLQLQWRLWMFRGYIVVEEERVLFKPRYQQSLVSLRVKPIILALAPQLGVFEQIVHQLGQRVRSGLGRCGPHLVC